ncbi:hypothetical protein COLO4_10015 [Corchorus olitorius]|uniref:DC1 domain-containing protein n=1 Tax=Corchorus olitorius TaxID=93759 RepID=A0A1R3KAA9_9ROSI|nr:hypothetical protein COLO4_10015 [Corchorus olitorius]
MHVECAQRPNMETDGDNEKIIQHFTHWHPLTLLDEDEDGKKDLQVGNATFLSKNPASSTFHDGSIIVSDLVHPSCSLILLTASQNKKCKGCDDEPVSGLVFRCSRCRFRLDVKCALLPTLDHSKDIADKIQAVVSAMAVEGAILHPLRLVDENRKKDLQVGCGICDKLICFDSASVAYGCEECNFFLHKSCMINIPDRSNMPSTHHTLSFCSHQLNLGVWVVMMNTTQAWSFAAEIVNSNWMSNALYFQL